MVLKHIFYNIFELYFWIKETFLKPLFKSTKESFRSASTSVLYFQKDFK